MATIVFVGLLVTMGYATPSVSPSDEPQQAKSVEEYLTDAAKADFATDIELKKEILLRAISAEGPAEDLAEAERALARLEWMEEHGSEINGLDPELPLLPQFDLLTDEQIRAAFRSMDPLVN